MKFSQEWVCTDPDQNQWGRQIGDDMYEFKEDDPFEEDDGVRQETIVLSHYSDKIKEYCINSFGYSLYETKDGNQNIDELYGDQSDWIIAECLFELNC